MFRSTVLALLAALAFVVSPMSAHAASINCTSSIVTLVAGNLSTDSAHLIYINSCTGLCTANRAYIEFEDKAIFAQALAAKTGGITINMQVDTSATAKGSVTHGTPTCRVISLWY